MQKAISYRDATGALYDIPEEEAEAFKREMPQARPVRTFRDAAGAMYDVPEEEAEAFRTDMPQAEPVRIVRAAGGDDGGAVFEVPDSERETFLQGYRSEPEFEADREAARARVEARGTQPSKLRDAGEIAGAAARGYGRGVAAGAMETAGALTAAVQNMVEAPVARAIGADRHVENVKQSQAWWNAKTEEMRGTDRPSPAQGVEGWIDDMSAAGAKVNRLVGGMAGGIAAIKAGGAAGLGAATLPVLGAAEAYGAGGGVQEMAVGAVGGATRQAILGGARVLPAGAAGAVGAAGFSGLSAMQGKRGEDLLVDALMGGVLAGYGSVKAGGSMERARLTLREGLRPVADSNWWRKLTIRERGLVLRSLETGQSAEALRQMGAPRDVVARVESRLTEAQRIRAKLRQGDRSGFEAAQAERMQGESANTAQGTGAGMPAGTVGRGQGAGIVGRGQGAGGSAGPGMPAGTVGRGQGAGGRGAPELSPLFKPALRRATPEQAAEAMRVNREVEAGWQAAQARREQAKLDRKQETVDKRKAARQPGAESEAARTRRLSLESFYDRNHTRLNLPMVERMLAGQVFRAPSKRAGGEYDAWKALGEKYPELRMRMSRDTRGGPGIPIEVAAQEEGMQPDEMVAQIEREWNEYQEWKRNDGRLAEDNPDQAIAERAVENLTVPVETTTDRLAPGDMVRTPDGQWRRVEREPDTVILADGTDIVLPEDSEQAVKLEAHVPAGEPGIEEARRAYTEQERAMWAEAERERIAAEAAAPEAAGQATQVAEKGAAQPEPGPAALALEGQTQEQMDAEAQARTAEEQRREMLARAAAPIEGNAGDTTAVIPGMEGEVAPNLFDAAEVEARRALDLPPIETQAVAEQKPVEQSAPTTAPASKSPELMTPEQDAAYMRAVESGDTATARRMVDEAARRAFLYRYLLSGTVHPSIKSSYATDFPPMAVHFAERMQAIGAPRPGKTGDGVVHVYSRDGAIYRTQNEYSLPTGATPLNEYSPIEVREGKHLEMVGPTDPVTYDDAGRVIPLSERFNPVPPPGWIRQSADFARQALGMEEEGEMGDGGRVAAVPSPAQPGPVGAAGDVEAAARARGREGAITLPSGVPKGMRATLRRIGALFVPNRGVGNAVYDLYNETQRKLMAAPLAGREYRNRIRGVVDGLQAVHGRDNVMQAIGEVQVGELTPGEFSKRFGLARGNEVETFLAGMLRDTEAASQKILKWAGRSQEARRNVAEMTFYQTRAYLVHALGEGYDPPASARRAASIEFKAGLADAVDRLARGATAVRGKRGGLDVVSWLETGDETFLRHASRTRADAARVLRGRYLALRGLIDGLAVQGDQVTARMNAEAAARAADGFVEFYLKRSAERGQGGGSSAGSVETGHLRARFLEGALRDLYGEITDPAVRQQITTEVQARMLAEMTFFERVFAESEGAVWAYQPDAEKGILSRLGDERNQADRMKYGDMAGRYVTAEFKELIDAARNKGAVHRTMQAIYFGPMAFQRMAKLLAPKTISRNYITALMGFGLQSGDVFLPGYWGDFWQGHRLAADYAKGRPDAIARVRELTELGVFAAGGTSATADMQAALGGAGKRMRKLGKGVTEAYVFIDFPTKYAAFQARQRAGMSRDQAVQHVQDLYQNRERTPAIVGKVSRIGLADYLSYSYDSTRIALNGMRHAVAEAKAGRILPMFGWITARSLFALTSVLATKMASEAVGKLYAEIARLIRPDDDDEEKKGKKPGITPLESVQIAQMRRLVMPYDANAPLLAWRETQGGKLKYVGYTVAGGQTAFPIDDWIVGMLQSPNHGEGFLNAVGGSIGSLVDEGMYVDSWARAIGGEGFDGKRTPTGKGLWHVMPGKEEPERAQIIGDAIKGWIADMAPTYPAKMFMQLMRRERDLDAGIENVGIFARRQRSAAEIVVGEHRLVRSYTLNRAEMNAAVRNAIRPQMEGLERTRQIVSGAARQRIEQGAIRPRNEAAAESAQEARGGYVRDVADTLKAARTVAPEWWDVMSMNLVLKESGMPEQEIIQVLQTVTDMPTDTRYFPSPNVSPLRTRIYQDLTR